MKIIDFKRGLTFHVLSPKSEFLKQLKKLLNLLRITWWDPCCSTEATETPVRFNVTTGTLERVTPATGEWEEATASNIQSITTGLTAFATGGQASATALPSQFNEVTTVATAGDSVRLPVAVAGTVVIVKNEGAASMDVFPATGDTINDGAANAAIAVPAGSTATFTAINATNWETNTQTQVASAVINAAGTMFAGFYPVVAQNDIAAATGGAIIVTNYLTTINTDAGGDAFTLANGTQTGQLKKILLVVDGGGDGVVTPATALAGGATTITFDDAADFVVLLWNGTAWAVIENSGTIIA